MNDVGVGVPATSLRAGSARAGYFRIVSSVVAVCLLVASAFAANPVPTVTAPVSPSAVEPGRGPFVLTVYGANFVPGAVVNWNRSHRKTKYISSRELQAKILASDVRKPTAGFVTVTNPHPDGGESSSSYGLVEVHKARQSLDLQSPYSYGSEKQGEVAYLVTTDVNHDGNLDLVQGDGIPQDIIVNLGSRSGRFNRGRVVSTGYFELGGIASGDFNNDGNVDVMFSDGDYQNYPPTYATVELGNGKGGFKFGSQFGDFAVTTQFAVGDFNGDGKLDVAVADTDNGLISIFLGNGDGTFTHLVNYSQAALNIVAADFNGDGNLDLAVDAGDGGIWALMGNGDGTFQNPVEVTSTSGVCLFGPPMLVGDFNRDGKLDLAFCNDSQIGILLGNGNGTFEAPVYYNAGQDKGFSFAAGDFYSNDKTDLIVSQDQGNFNFYLMNGNGDGTFQSEKQIQLPGGPDNGELGIVVGDFNSDGLLDFIFLRGGWGMAEYLQK